MNPYGTRVSVASLLLALLLPACSGGGSDSESAGTMFIETCSLGCSSGSSGFQISCANNQADLNEEITITFSQPVDPASVNSSSFQLIALSGQVPIGTRFVDPSDPRRVIFRPAVTFDTVGSPTFGFSPDTTYRITIPGQAQDENGPFIRSTGGKPNKTRMLCEVLTTNDINDSVPGSPIATVFVDVDNPATPDPDDVLADQPADGATDVALTTNIKVVFNDLMSPATLVNTQTQTPVLISFKVDEDGNLATTNDQVPLFGTAVLTLDLNALTSTLLFTPSTGIPQGGDPELHPLPRQVVVNFPAGIQDLAGNSIANPGFVAFTPKVVDFDEVVLPDANGENFTNTSNQNLAESGAEWGGGRLTRGYGGGSGRLGKLHIKTTDGTVTLNTDSQVFPLAIQGGAGVPDLLSNYPDGGTPPTQITITDGQFEFSSLIIEPGATLKLAGSKPARVFVRGPATIFGNGIVDISGVMPPVFSSDTGLGQTGGVAGPAGGNGGDGGDRIDAAGTDLLGVGGTDVGADGVQTPGLSFDGTNGGGVGGSPSTLAAGPGGKKYVTQFPTTTINDGNLSYNYDSASSGCISRQVGMPGGGGGYATDGTAPTPMSSVPLDNQGAPTTPPPQSPSAGLSSDLQLEPPDPQSAHSKRGLAYELGYLRGGSGGGGGSSNLHGTVSNEVFPAGDICQNASSSSVSIQTLWDHSGAAGGGGGGAVQIISGRTLLLAGLVNARGGGGASAIAVDPDPPPNPDVNRELMTSPGGAGAGGGVKLQALQLAIENTPGFPHIDISGGFGGTNLFDALGGDGGIGLVRLEDTTGNLTRAGESPKVFPLDPDGESENWISVGPWARPRRRPESFTASVSCWMRPEGSFFQLVFREDDLANPVPAERYGWNMDVIYQPDGDPVEHVFAYRGTNDPSWPNAQDVETTLGNLLNHGLPNGQGSYLAVRFQGAKSTSALSNPCDVELSGVDSQIAPGSLTPWVKHPDELNAFGSNMVRFTVVFDFALANNGSLGDFIKGVTNLRIRAQPD